MTKKVLVSTLLILILSISISPLENIFGKNIDWVYSLKYHDLQDFISAVEKKGVDGYKLTDLEIDPVTKEIYGIFEKSNERVASWYLASADRFSEKTSDFRNEGLYLTDVEITPTSNGLLYSGIFESTDSPTIWKAGIPTSNIESFIDKTKANSYKLIDMETYLKDGQVTFFVVFEKGDIPQSAFWNLSPESYRSLRDDLKSEGLRIADIELIKIGNEWRYSGFFDNSNQGGANYFNYYYKDFKSILDQASDGVSVVDFEVYPRHTVIFDGSFTAQNIGPKDRCIAEPFSNGCQASQPQDPCIDDPLSAGCLPKNGGGGPVIEIPKLPPEFGVVIPPITEWELPW